MYSFFPASDVASVSRGSHGLPIVVSTTRTAPRRRETQFPPVSPLCRHRKTRTRPNRSRPSQWQRSSKASTTCRPRTGQTRRQGSATAAQLLERDDSLALLRRNRAPHGSRQRPDDRDSCRLATWSDRSSLQPSSTIRHACPYRVSIASGQLKRRRVRRSDHSTSGETSRRLMRACATPLALGVQSAVRVR